MSVQATADSTAPENRATAAGGSVRADEVCRGLLVAGVVSYALFFSWYCCLLLGEHAYSGYDLSIFSQAAWLISHGEAPFSTVRGSHLLGDHFSVILFVLAPLCRLGSSPMALLIAQSVALALGAIPVYALALHVLRSAPIALLFAFTYLLNPSIHGYNLREFHPDSFAVPLLLGAFYFLHAGRRRGLVVCLVLAAMTKETMALALIPLGVYAAFIDRRSGAAAVSVGVVALVISMGTMRYFSGISTPYTVDLYGSYGRTPTEVAWNVTTHPSHLASAATTEDGKAYLSELLTPLAFAPLLAPGVAAVAVPALAANLLGRRESFRQASWWYSAPITPILFGAAILGFARFYRWRIKGLTAVLLINLTIAAVVSGATGPLASPERLGFPALTSRQASDAESVLSRIPAEASVSAQTPLLPELIERPHVYVFPNPFYSWGWGATANALLQLEGKAFPEWSAEQYESAITAAPVEYVMLGPQPILVIPKPIYDALFAAVLACPRYGIVEVRGAYTLLWRGADYAAGIRKLETASGMAVRTKEDLMKAYKRTCEQSENAVESEGPK